MKDPRGFVTKFANRHPNFGLPNLMKYVAIANVAFWLISLVNPVLYSYLVFSPRLILQGQLWRMVTFAFMPSTTGLLALVSIYFYYWIGNTLEQYWGTAQFNLFFFSGMLFTVVYGLAVWLLFRVDVPATAEYVYLSMFLAFAVMFPDTSVFLLFIPIPIKMKWLAIVDAVFFVYEVIISPFPYKLLPVVAMLNFFIFCGGDLFRAFPAKQSRAGINFRKESSRIRREQAQKLYNHQCAVCGKTDTEYPELEFRYCSRCAGYHCFCQEHINNHVHFQE